MKNSQRYIYGIGQGRLKDTKEVDEQTATDTELYNNLQNDPVRYVDIMTHKYDNNKKPKDYPRKIVVPTRKVTDQTPAKNKEISHGEPIDVQELSKDIDRLMANNLITDPIVAPDLSKKVDPDLLKGVGYLMGSIPEDFKN